jgi:hypothetical protein
MHRLPSVAAPLSLAVLALSTLTYCSSTPEAPSQYHQGVYRPVRAPVFTPSQDAPITTGQPGHVRTQPQPERSPHKRVLPASVEPGLWAGDGPRASVGGMPKIMGVPFPFPPDMSMDDMGPHLACAELMTRALALTPNAAAFEARLTDAQRKCMSASLYDICEQEVFRGNKVAKSEGLYDAVLFNRIKAAAERTAAHRAGACRGIAMPEDSDKIAEAAYLRLMELLKEFERPAP